jgi:WD40 repeat protein
MHQLLGNQLLGTLSGHTGPVTSVAFSPDGATPASASDDRSIRLWDVQTRLLLGTLSGHTDVVTSVAFSPDGATLASAGGDRNIRLWDFDPASLKMRACKMANRNFSEKEWRKFFGDQPYRKTCPDLPEPQKATKAEPAS